MLWKTSFLIPFYVKRNFYKPCNNSLQQKAFYDAVNKIRAEIVDANDTAQLFIEVADELEQKFSTSDTDEAVDASVIPDISEQVRIAVLTPHVKFDSKNLVVQLLQVDKIVLNREVHFQLKHIGQSQEQKSIKGLSGGISGDAPPIAAIAERATMHLNPAETGDEDATAREHATNFTFINKEPAPNPDIIPLQEGEKEIDYRTRVEEKVKQRILQLKTNPAIKEYLIKFLNQKAMFGAFGDYIMRDINALSTITPDLIGDFIASKSFASLFEGSKKYTLEVEENQAIYTHEFYSSETPPTVIGLFRFKILPDGGDKIKIILENAEIEVSANTLKPTSVYVSGGKQKLVDFPKLLQETLCKQAYNFAAASNQNITIDHITAIKPLAKKLERLLHPEKNQAELKKIIREQLEPICTSESILTANAFTALRKTFTPEQLLQLKDYAEFNTFAIHLREADRYSLVAQMLQYVNDILNDRKRTYHFTKVEIVALLKNLHGFEPALVGYHEGSMLQFAMQVLEDELEHTLKSTNTTIKELLEEFDSNVKPEDYRHIRYQLQRAALTPQVSFDQDGNLLPKVTVDPWRLQGAMKRVGRMISSEKILSEKQGTEAAQALARKLPTDIYDPKLAFQFMGPRRVLDPKFTEDTPITRGGNVFINVNGKNIFEFKNESQKARSTEEAYRVFNTDVLPLLLKNLDPSIMTYLKGFIGMPFGLTNQQIPLKVLAADFALKFLNLTIPDDQKELFTQFLLGTDSENLNWNFFIKDKDNLTISVTTSRQQLIFSLQKQLDGRVLILPTRVSCIIADKKELGGQQCKLEKLSGNDAITLLPCENSTSDSFSAYDSWKKVYTQISSKLQQQKALDFNDVTATLLKIETLLLKAPENLTSEEIKNHLALWANQLNYLVNENQAYLGGILQQGLLPLLTSYDNGSSPDQPLTQALDNLYWEYFTSQKFILPHLEQISRHEILNRESESYAQNRPAYAVNAALKETLEKLSNERGISLAEKKIISKAIDDAAYVLTASIRHKPGELHINELLNVLADAPSFQLTPASNTAPKETSRDLPASALEQLSKNFEDLKPLSQKALKDLFVNIGNDNAQAPKAQSVVNRTATYFPKIAVNMAHHLDGSQVSSMIKGMQKIQRPSYNQEDKSATIVAKAELARSTAEQTRLFGDVIGGKVSFKAWWAGAPFNPFKKPKYTAEQLKDLILADPSSLEQVFSVKANRELFANTPAFRELLNTFLISLDDSKTVNTIFNIISQYPDLQISP
ncbi:MAG: hypothetical protein K0R98_2041, partial [Rickettsiaceae bacterium]|nr:hypothetical protein [Rickettsiaceae bacterium]